MRAQISRGCIACFAPFVAALLAVAPARATVFGIESCYDSVACPGAIVGTQTGGPPSKLFRFEENGAGAVEVGNITLGGNNINTDALAMSHNHGLLAFEVGPMGSRLLSLSAASGTATALGGFMSDRNIRGATFDLNDKLIVLDAANSHLLRVDPMTGSVIGAPVALSLSSNAYMLTDGIDIAVRPDGTLVMVTYEHPVTRFYSVNATTGALNLLHSDATVQSPGLPVFYPGATYSQLGGDTLFGFEANSLEDIFTYSSTWTRSLLISNFPAGYNSGRGDLAALMPYIPLTGVPGPASLPLLGAALLMIRALRRHRA